MAKLCCVGGDGRLVGVTQGMQEPTRGSATWNDDVSSDRMATSSMQPRLLLAQPSRRILDICNSFAVPSEKSPGSLCMRSQRALPARRP